MTDLSDFGGGVTESAPPRIKKRRPFAMHMPNGERRTICHLGPANREPGVAAVAVKERSTPQEDRHSIRKLDDVYAFSKPALDFMRRQGAAYVFIHEQPSDTVHEFRVRAFNERVPPEVIGGAHDRGQDRGPQYYAPWDRLVNRWPDHGHNGALYVRQGDPDPTP